MARHYRAALYVTHGGRFVGARFTDQAGRNGPGTEGRTYKGHAVELAGDSYTVLRQYQQAAIASARHRAMSREAVLICSQECEAGDVADGLEPHPLPPGIGPFLAAIVAAFGDEAPVLILADWLEEHGDDFRAWLLRALVEETNR